MISLVIIVNETLWQDAIDIRILEESSQFEMTFIALSKNSSVPALTPSIEVLT